LFLSRNTLNSCYFGIRYNGTSSIF
jgi:hypothetical protein